ncbi:MAG: hypothetical protein AB1567_06135 [bacterium]
MHKEFIQGVICGVIATTLLLGISSLVYKKSKENENQTITHLQISKEPLKKSIVEIFYPKGNTTQEKLAERILEILVKEYELIEKVLEIPLHKILSYQTYGLVFCEDIDDIFLKYTNEGLASIDGVLCYPVVGEVGFPFRDPKTRFRVVYNIPKELVKGILKGRLNLKDDALWFAEGIGGYIGFLCWQELDRHAFFNYEYPRVLKLSSKINPKPDTIDLTDYQTFKEAEYLFYPASIFIIIDLVTRYGRGIIAKTIFKLEKTKDRIGSEEIAQTIKELKDEDILPRLKAVSLKKTEERFKLLESKLL